MKRFKSGKAYLVCMVVMSVFVSILSGCGGGGGGHWYAPATPGAPGALAVTVVSPIAGSTVPINTKVISASFNKEMAPATFTPASFTLVCNATPITGGVYTYQAAGSLATLTLPAADLPALAPCTATITTAAKDLTGNALATDYTWNFTTGAAAVTTNPMVFSTVPLTSTPEPTDVPTTTLITVTFDKTMDAATITAAGAFTVAGVTPAATAVTYENATNTATFHPLAALNPGIRYTATIKGTGVAPVKDSTGNILAGNPLQPTVPNDYSWSFTTAVAVIPHLGPLAVNLLSTQPYGVLSNTGVTLGGGPASTTGFRVDGDVGIFPAGACVGCDNTTVTKLIENGTVPAQTAMTDLVAVYNDAIGRTLNLCTLVGSGALTVNPSLACGGTANGTFAPGLYWSSTSIAIPAGGTITLDGKNDPTAVFIFQSESSIDTIGGNTHVILTNQAQAKNVFWVAKSTATIGGTTSDFKGTAIALIAVTVNTGTDMLGRALARGAAVTVQDGAKITVPLP